MRPGNSRISGCSEPPKATFISCKPRQMPNSGTPRATQASDQRQRQHRRAGCRRVRAGMRLGAEAGRVDIGAGAGQHHAVDRVEQRADIGDLGRSRRTSAAARRQPQPRRGDFALRPSAWQIDFRCGKRFRSRRPPAFSSSSISISPHGVPERIMPAGRQGINGLGRNAAMLFSRKRLFGVEGGWPAIRPP